MNGFVTWCYFTDELWKCKPFLCHMLNCTCFKTLPCLVLIFNMQRVNYKYQWRACTVPSCGHPSHKAASPELQEVSMAWSRDSTSICTHPHSHKPLGENWGCSFFSFCLWWCSLAEVTPGALGHVKESSDNRHRKWTRMPQGDIISYWCTTELDNICKLEATAVWRDVETQVLAWYVTICVCQQTSMLFRKACNYVECVANLNAHEPCACVRACCTWIVHAWLASVPEVLQGPGKEAASSIWRRGSQPLVCAVTLLEGFLQHGGKWEDGRGEQQSLLGGGIQPCLLIASCPFHPPF